MSSLHPKAKYYLGKGVFNNISSFGQLEKRIAKLKDPMEMGMAFEVFAEAYLATSAVENAEVVWPADTVKPSVRKKLHLPSSDKGADGVIKTRSGIYRGYQVKFRSRRKPLNWQEVSTFFGLTDRCDERLLFTNSVDISEVAEQRKDFSSVRGNDLDQMERKDFARIEKWLKGKAVVRERWKPRPHQKKILTAITKTLKDQDRATVVSACGTGKTLVALWAAEALTDKTVLVLLPSLALLRQTLKEWVGQTKWDPYDYLCVCSDHTVNKGNDELLIQPTELEFSVTSKPEEVSRFLKHRFGGTKIIFSTYQSAEVVAAGMGEKRKFDFGIFDEAHKTAGRRGTKFSFALTDDNLRIKKRLFLTATPRHYNLQKRNREGEPVEVYSMNRPEIYGPVCHTLSFAEAAKLDIICNYKVVISVVTSEMLDRFKIRKGVAVIDGEQISAAHVANQVALAQAVQTHDLKKIFTFHHRVNSARSFTSDGAEGIGRYLPGFETYHVSGAMPTKEREAWLTEFKQCDRAVMSNARCLTEGVDVPAVDMVAFLTPKRSKVDIVQAIGRAMRKSKGKSYGYVLVPLYLEQSKGESEEEAIEASDFSEVWAVLQAMQEQDKALDETIHAMKAGDRIGKKRGGFAGRVEVIGPTVNLETIRDAITTKCLERLTRPWDEMVQMLLAYQEEKGDLNVPAEAAAPWEELGKWVDHVRAQKRNGHLSEERKAQLEEIGLDWKVEGETLDSTEGLLNERQFIKVSGLSSIARYRKRGLIEPVGWAKSSTKHSAYYHPDQITTLKLKLGITLDSYEGLLNEYEFSKRAGLRNIANYRKKGLILPVGFAIAGGSVSAHYHPDQIEELKKKLGITLDDTHGLVNEWQFKKLSGLSSVTRYREKGLIEPTGWATTNAGVSPFYNPNQVDELKKKLGITLDDTEGLLNEAEFMEATKFTSVARYRKKGLIKPVGWAMSVSNVSAYYHPDQVDELKRMLGVTLESTEGLLNESEFINATKFTNVARYRKNGLIEPVGYAMAGPGVSAFYHPDQIAGFRAKLGITLENTQGLLNEKQFSKASGISNIKKYREQGIIEPVGWAMTNGGVSPFYHPDQITELKKKLAEEK